MYEKISEGNEYFSRPLSNYLGQDYTLFETSDNLTKNYTSNESSHNESEFLKHATHTPFTCGGCEYHNH